MLDRLYTCPLYKHTHAIIHYSCACLACLTSQLQPIKYFKPPNPCIESNQLLLYIVPYYYLLNNAHSCRKISIFVLQRWLFFMLNGVVTDLCLDICCIMDYSCITLMAENDAT